MQLILWLCRLLIAMNVQQVHAAAGKAADGLHISGRLAQAKIRDSVSISIYESNAMDRGVPWSAKVKKYQLEINNGYFSGVLPMQSAYAYVKMELAQKINVLNTGFLMVKRGDSLAIVLEGDQVRFEGAMPKHIGIQADFYEHAKYTVGLSLWNSKQISKLFDRCDSVIRHYQNQWDQIGGKTAAILSAEYAARARTELLYAVFRLRHRKEPAFRQAVRLGIQQMKLNIDLQLAAQVVEHTVSYYNSLWLLYQVELAMRSEQGQPLLYELYDRFRELPYPLNDRMTAFQVWKDFASTTSAFGFPKVMLEVKDPLAVGLLNEVMAHKATGEMAYPFRLPDVNGTYHELSHFKGKTIVVHFWFTNCAACKMLSEQLHPIIAKYAGNSGVIFLNVNVDRDKDTWKRSLKTGEYSHPSELALFTEGLGAAHPFLKYYNFKAFPSMLVVGADGKLISAAPTRPTDETTGKQFEELLQRR